MLKYSEFVPHAPNEVGFVRINHDSPRCSGTSKSMRIDRHDNGSISAYCFRCHSSGNYRGDGLVVTSARKAVGAERSEHRFIDGLASQYNSGDDDSSAWPVSATYWIRSKSITPEEIRRYGIRFSPLSNRVIFPIYWEGNLEGYISRKIYKEDKLPKYINNLKSKVAFKSIIHDKDEVVIVEDILSAIKVGRITNCIAILGTSINDTILKYLLQYKSYIIWLDNDNRVVINNSIKLLKRLRLFGKVKYINTDKDPKEYTDKEIEEILYGT